MGDPHPPGTRIEPAPRRRIPGGAIREEIVSNRPADTGRKSAEFLQAVFDATPHPVFLVDSDVRVEALNAAARPLVGAATSVVYRKRGGDALGCVHSHDDPGGCGKGPDCKSCVIRNSVRKAFGNQRVVRQPTRMTVDGPEGPSDVYMLVTSAPLVFEGRQMVVLTLEEINELVELRRLIPICAWCKKIRNEESYWQSVEAYLKDHLDMDFSHGICPDCLTRLHPGIAASIAEESDKEAGGPTALPHGREKEGRADEPVTTRSDPPSD